MAWLVCQYVGAPAIVLVVRGISGLKRRHVDDECLSDVSGEEEEKRRGARGCAKG